MHEDILDAFVARALRRVAAIRMGDPLDPATMLGAQNSTLQLEKILGYLEVGRREGARALCGGAQARLPGELAGGFYVQPTVFRGDNEMRVFQARALPGLAVITCIQSASSMAGA